MWTGRSGCPRQRVTHHPDFADVGSSSSRVTRPHSTQSSPNVSTSISKRFAQKTQNQSSHKKMDHMRQCYASPHHNTSVRRQARSCISSAHDEIKIALSPPCRALRNPSPPSNLAPVAKLTPSSITMTITMTMTHSEKSVQQSLESWPYKRERRGHDPAKKSFKADVACSVGKVCTYTLLMTACSTSNTKRKKTKG